MNSAQQSMTQLYLRDLADRLLLRDWEILLQREYPPQDDCWAHIEISHQRNVAWVRVAWPEFFIQKTQEEQRSALVHELLHCHLDRIDMPMRQLAEMFPENTATQFAAKEECRLNELATDNLAAIIAPFMPLPPRFPTEPDPRGPGWTTFDPDKKRITK